MVVSDAWDLTLITEKRLDPLYIHLNERFYSTLSGALKVNNSYDFLESSLSSIQLFTFKLELDRIVNNTKVFLDSPFRAKVQKAKHRKALSQLEKLDILI